MHNYHLLFVDNVFFLTFLHAYKHMYTRVSVHVNNVNSNVHKTISIENLLLIKWMYLSL